MREERDCGAENKAWGQNLELHSLLHGETSEELKMQKCHHAFENKLNPEFLYLKPVGGGALLAVLSCLKTKVMVINF